MKKLNYGEPKPTLMTLKLVVRSISYLCGVLKNVFVRVDGLFFLADFVVLDMPEDAETPLILGRPFLATSRGFIDVEPGELIIFIQ